MSAIFDKIMDFIKDFLISLITGSLNTMFDDVNTKVGTIAADVGQTPQSWNGNVFSLLQNLSETVIVLIAGLIITFILCYELITMITEKNNLHNGHRFRMGKKFGAVSYLHILAPELTDKMLVESGMDFTNDAVIQICNYANLAASMGKSRNAICALKRYAEEVKQYNSEYNSNYTNLV